MNHNFKLRSLLQKALQEKASDIHITIRKMQSTVELRTIDSRLISIQTQISSGFIQFLKIKAHIDLLSALKPQTGQFEVKLGQVTLSIRMAYLKNKQLESIVLRILNSELRFQIDDLFKDEDLRQIKEALNQKAGLILISGTTGSGKTTSLYSFLDYLKEQKIYSIEDPIEIIKDHVIQLQINKLAHFNFSEAIKQILRHDPNIIVIGEIRSQEEAQAALSCSLSGHLVLSTIHASSAEITIKRMIDLGCDKEVLDDSLLSIFHQDLCFNLEENKRKVEIQILTRNDINQIMAR